MKTGGGWAGLGAAGRSENQEEKRLPGAWDGEEEGGQLPARPQAPQAGQPRRPVLRGPAPSQGTAGRLLRGRGGGGGRRTVAWAQSRPLGCTGGLSTPGPPAMAAWPPTGCIQPPRASGCPPRPLGKGRRRPGPALRPCLAVLAAVQLQALPPAAPLWVPEAFSAIQMEMPRGWRMETLFPA